MFRPRDGHLSSQCLVLVAILLLSPWPEQLDPHSQDLWEKLFGSHHAGNEPHATAASRGPGKLASAQGLSVPDESLGAGELATLDQLDQFESLLELSDEFTGGRRPGPKHTGSRRGAAFEDTQYLRQQQLELYYVAGAPQIYHSFNTSQTVDGKNYLPRVRDQGSCSTCVAHAVAEAVAASVASVLHVDAVDWDISAQSLYYCSYGGKTCASGWQIADAMSVIETNPEIVRPSNCTPDNLAEPEIGSWAGVCSAATSTCSPKDMTKPWLTCTYKALSSFWQIQQSVRHYGAAVTRITIYDDFRSSFDPSKSGLENSIYTPKPGAKKLYGHAAIIVGYDNVNMAWTLLNSWGTRATKDGLFRIAMGQAGVGAPEETYAVICEPQPGTDLDPHEHKPWKWEHRKPVRLVNPVQDRTNLAAPCFYYDAVPGDTAASIADAFLVDIRRLVKNNTRVFQPITLAMHYNDSMTSDEIMNILTNINTLQQDLSTFEPYFNCTASIGSIKECRLSAGSVQACAGVSNCTLYYQEPDVSISPVNQALLLCGISSAPGQFNTIAYFTDPAVSQSRALRQLLDEYKYQDVPVPDDYCDSSAWLGPNNPQRHLFPGRWVTACADGYVTSLYADIGISEDSNSHLHLNQQLAELLLLFERLDSLFVHARPGSTVPTQLGALTHLQSFYVYSWCWQGILPQNLGRGWPNITSLTVYQEESTTKGCGVTGTLPQLWGTTLSNLQSLDISNQRLSGTLPPEYAQMPQLSYVSLHHNQLEGELPSSYAEWSTIGTIDLSNNKLQGEIPPTWASLQGRLMTLQLSNNARLKGCIPLTAYTTVKHVNTQLTGWCTNNKQDIEQQQSDALRTLLPSLLNADGQAWSALDLAVDIFQGPLSDKWAGGDGHLLHSWTNSDARGVLWFQLRVRDGIVYLTYLDVQGAGIDLTVLPELIARLPRLEVFKCTSCHWNKGNADAMRLPATLAAKAPRSFMHLEIVDSSVQGRLPDEWGSWSTLVNLNIENNQVTGALPASWKGMSALASLNLGGNRFQGALPPEWGYGGIANVSELFLHNNPGLMGTIPAEWGSFSGGVFLRQTGVTGCIPDQLMTNIYWDLDKIPCSSNNSEVSSLLALRKFLDPTGLVLSSWDRMNSGPEERPGSMPPGYCSKFVGVTCNNLNQVTGLDLARLNSKGLMVKTKLSLNRLLQVAAKFPVLQVLKLADNRAIFSSSKLQPQVFLRFKALQHLDLSGCALSGPVPPSLAGAVSLQHINLSSNPLLSGPLPEIWAGLTDLQVLDVSGCGVTGRLPESWAAMQLLREFKLGNNKPGVSGQLPESWGMLESLQVLDVSGSKLTGPIPAVWADPTAMAARAAVSLATARRRATAPKTVVPGLSMEQTQQLARAAADAEMAALQRAVDTQASRKLGMLKLQQLRLSGNRLTGQLPKTFDNMGDLKEVLLDRNRLSGPLPVGWASLKELQVLDLANNKLTGPLPPYWSTLSSLEVMSLSHNPLSGCLPGPWGGLRSLKQLGLSACNLDGKLPATWFGMKKVQRIDLSNNLLMGKFPVQWGLMGDAGSHRLLSLDLSGNVCMDEGVLQDSISKSKITASGRVTVNITGVGGGGLNCV